MANYYGTARTNYFKVKDAALFKSFLVKFNLNRDQTLARDASGEGCAILFEDGIPSFYETDDGETDEIDFPEELAKHLQDGEIAIFMEAGAEKMRYISGHATAINSNGERIDIDLNQIYNKALKKFKTIPTRAEY